MANEECDDFNQYPYILHNLLITSKPGDELEGFSQRRRIWKEGFSQTLWNFLFIAFKMYLKLILNTYRICVKGLTGFQILCILVIG